MSVAELYWKPNNTNARSLDCIYFTTYKVMCFFPEKRQETVSIVNFEMEEMVLTLSNCI